MRNYIWLIAAALVLVGMLWVASDPPPHCRAFKSLPGCPQIAGGNGGNGGNDGESDNAGNNGISPAITISIASSITKTEWLDDAVETFNAASKSDSSLQVGGRPIEVNILKEKDPVTSRERHWNSGTQVKATLNREIEPTILSPATTFWISWLNKEWRAYNNGREISTGAAPSVLTTPVVIAMWQSRAEALGCWPTPGPECTWQSILELANSADGWGMLGHPEWGKFHFGYAYVGESDVGTQTAVLICMTGLKNTGSLTISEVQTTNGCGQAITDVEKAIVHRGTSSPLILRAMQQGGPAFLDAVTTYEKNVIGFNRTNQQSPRQMVAVYPQDGTVVADHPIAIMDQAPWVTPEQVEAAKVFQAFLFSAGQQQNLVQWGLRPIEDNISLGSPIDRSYGAIPSVDVVNERQVPEVLVVDQVDTVWNDLKKPANISLVFDKSGSMQGEKINQAIIGATGFVDQMSRKDWLFWLPFDSQIFPGTKGLKSEVGEELKSEIESTTARGETALYDAVAHAYQELEALREQQGDTARYGIVVLSDGQDTSSETSLALLEAMMRPTEGTLGGIDVHTIGIGDDTDDEILTKIASFTPGGQYWKVEDLSTLEAVYKRISRYF